MDWNKSQAKRVCEASFGGDVEAMRRYARRYLDGEAVSLPPLGRPFREIVLKQARGEWWRRAIRILESNHPHGAPPVGVDSLRLPQWCKTAGGLNRWRKWVGARVRGCQQRALRWSQKVGRSPEMLPSAAEWRAAILNALHQSNGIAHWSRLRLSLDQEHGSHDALYPSVDHLQDPGTADVVIETRGVNDMRTIFSEREFREIVAHMAWSLGVSPTPLRGGWTCQRCYRLVEPSPLLGQCEKQKDGE